VDAARKQSLLMSNAVDLARSTRLFGLVEVGVEVEQDPEGTRIFGPTLSLQLPLFDRRQAVIARLEAQKRQSERRLLAIAVEVRSHVRLARARLMAARQRVEHYRKVLLPLHESVVAQAQLQYNGMQLGLGELLRARRAQLAARRAYIDEVRGYWVERAELERVMGGRLDLPAAGPGPGVDQAPKAPEPEPGAPEENHEHHTS
jgi:cobalt-zinc-cadmium efflux system outer membrane protein